MTGLGELVSWRRFLCFFSFLRCTTATVGFLSFLLLPLRSLWCFFSLESFSQSRSLLGAGISARGSASAASLRSLQAWASLQASPHGCPSATNCHRRQLMFQNSCCERELTLGRTLRQQYLHFTHPSSLPPL